MKKLYVFLLIIFGSTVFAQRTSDPSLLTIGYHTGNRAGITFYNDGQIAGINTGIDIRGEWPLGSGENYIGDCIPLIGVEFINTLNDTLQSVVISRGPRKGQFDEKSPDGYFWGWNPVPGFRNPNVKGVAMSHLPETWPLEGWNDPIARFWKDENGNTEWFGYFGRGIKNADQESFFEADDDWDDEFNGNFRPDSTNLSRYGMALRMRQRGFQWSSFLAEDAIFWLYEINNDGTTLYRKANFGTIVGTLAGGDGDSQDDLGFFDVKDWITYSWDSDGIGNRGQKVGYVGYAFLESPGNPFDGIDNDNDSKSSSPRFVASDFNAVIYNAGDQVVLIKDTVDALGLRIYKRRLHTVNATTDTVFSLGTRFIIEPGVTQFREGNATSEIINGQEVFIPDPSANDAIDNDLDGLVDENQATHYETRIRRQPPLPGLSYKNYVTGAGVNDLLIDEKRDNDIDEDGDWDPMFDDLGQDGLGPDDDNYPGPDAGEGDGLPTQGEPNFGKTDPDESDQIGLTGFNFFELQSAPDLSVDSSLWNRMTPGRFDVVPATPQDGDFIYSSGFFPLSPKTPERFSVALLFGEDLADIVKNKKIVQQIYNAGYAFPQAPKKPVITITQNDGKVVIYWDGEETENSRDFVTKQKDFEGYKIYRATDANFRDSRVITNALGVLSFDKPIAQYDLSNEYSGFFIPNAELLEAYGGTTFYFGENNGVINRFVDSTVTPGITYYYAVCAYDHGDGTPDIFPEENSKFIFRSNTGEVILDDNTAVITPGRRPAGYSNAFLDDLEKSDPFFGTGYSAVETVDDSQIRNNFNYQVVFQDTGLTDLTSSWSLLDLQTPDTVFVPIANQTYIVNPKDSIELPAGTDTIFVNGSKYAVTGSYYTAEYDRLVDQSDRFAGETPIRHGFRVQLYNDPVKVDTSYASDIPSVPPPTFEVLRFVANNPNYNGYATPNDYVIEFYDTIVDTSVVDTVGSGSSNMVPAQPVNFKVKNLTKDQYVDAVYIRFGTLSYTYSIWFKEYLQGQYVRTWRVNIRYRTFDPLETAGTFNIQTLKPFNQDDSYFFTMIGASINKADAQDQLNKIKVVPNPYIVTHAGEQRLLSTQTSGRGEREIRFTYVPPGSKISIFTVRGELIRTLYTESLYVGDVYWNLRSEENIDVAFGIYVFVVDAPNIGTKIGKFALIK
ncbi:MAG: hypothetical protein OQK57_02180 [Ignavibacteriaceae bacterium]|nr:hypothetical protein [Ignavibacteriaceae bacterium]